MRNLSVVRFRVGGRRLNANESTLPLNLSRTPTRRRSHTWRHAEKRAKCLPVMNATVMFVDTITASARSSIALDMMSVSYRRIRRKRTETQRKRTPVETLGSHVNSTLRTVDAIPLVNTDIAFARSWPIGTVAWYCNTISFVKTWPPSK